MCQPPRRFVLLLATALGAAGDADPDRDGPAAAGAPARRPNVMLIIADDMTWRDCEPYGNREVRTPHLARLAAQGMKFNRCFTATAMCAPTRQQLYTGVFPVRNGAYPNHSRVRDGTKGVVHHLRALGYRVGLVGKRHFGPAASFPFEFLASGKKAAGNLPAIEKFVNRDSSQPYCLIVASNEPHSPWNQGPRDYDPAKLTVPPYLEDTAETRQGMAKYYSEITFLDGLVGQCMKIVDESEGRDETILLFTSEQGSSFPFGGKWTCYDTGLKTALIVRWPGRVEPGSETDAMVQYVDILPTLIEAARGRPAEIDTGLPGAAGGGRGLDGRSFLGVLLGKSSRHRDHVYGVHTTRGIINGSPTYPVRSVRSIRFKYIRNLSWESAFTNAVTREGGVLSSWKRAAGKSRARAEAYQRRPAEELYDLEKDPWELHNLADDPAHQATRTALGAKLDAWMSQQGDRGLETELQARERQGRGERNRRQGEGRRRQRTGRK